VSIDEGRRCWSKDTLALERPDLWRQAGVARHAGGWGVVRAASDRAMLTAHELR
jgi:hypothetical protein